MGFKVIIVGGSISGLTLANILEHFDIEYILLEGHAKVAPRLGASIGILPSGLRVLDQLGCYERIREEAGDTYYRAQMRLFNGTTWYDKETTTFSERLHQRVGYPQIFIDRQMLVQILYDNLKSKQHIKTNERVTQVEMYDQQAVAYTKSGAIYSGDIIVGADGVHSLVRSEMWRNAAEDGENVFKGEDSGLQAVSKCIFGISQPPPTMPTSPFQVNSFFKNCGFMILSAPQNRVYWFLFTEMNKAVGKDIPKFSKKEECLHAEEHFEHRVTEETSFQEIYEAGQHTALVSLEEHVFPRWYYKRIVTIGDAAHKVHPISAQGGNIAIESAAGLANALRRRLNESPEKEKLSDDVLESLFAEFQDQRFARAVAAMEQGKRTTSVSIKDTWFARLFVDFFFARWGQALIYKLIVKNTDTALLVDDMPVPKRYTEAKAARLAEASKGMSSTMWRLGSLGVVSLVATVLCFRIV